MLRNPPQKISSKRDSVASGQESRVKDSFPSPEGALLGNSAITSHLFSPAIFLTFLGTLYWGLFPQDLFLMAQESVRQIIF